MVLVIIPLYGLIIYHFLIKYDDPNVCNLVDEETMELNDGIFDLVIKEFSELIQKNKKVRL